MPRLCKACNCGRVSESEREPSCRKSRVLADVEPSAGIHQPSSWRMPVSVESNRISSYFRPTEDGVAVMVRDGLKTSCHCPCQKSRQKVAYTQSIANRRVAAKPPRIQRALASGCCGASGFIHPGGGVCFCGKIRLRPERLFAMASRRRVRQPIQAEFHRCGTEPQSSRHTPTGHEQPARTKGTTGQPLEALEILLEVECQPSIPSL